MQIEKSTPKREITVSEVVLKVPAPYSEGHTLNAAEANVLNQTLAENLRNNFAGVVKAAKEAAGSLENVDVESLQAQLNAYIENYEFGARRQAGAAVDPVRKIAISLARDAVKRTIKAQGKDVKAYAAEDITKLAEGAVDKHPRFMEDAQRVYDAKKSVGNETLEDLAA